MKLAAEIERLTIGVGGGMAQSTILYRLIMGELERKRIELGLPMWQVDDLAGVADRYFSKAIYCDTPSGRRAGWEVLDEFTTALFGRGFTVEIRGEVVLPTGLASEPKVDARYLQQRHWRHLKFYREQGAKGGKANVARNGTEHMKKIGKRGGRIRWKKVAERAKQITAVLDKATGK